MNGRAGCEPLAMEPLPLAEFAELQPSPPRGPGADDSRYTAPTWVRSTPRRRPHRVAWPPSAPSLPADVFYEQLIRDISVDDRITRRVRGWAERARQRIADVLRPQLGEVDAVLCGSLAASTHVATADWDIDVAIRTYRSRPHWTADPAAALDDVSRWLSAGLEATVDRHSRSVSIQSGGGAAVHALVTWRADDRSVGFVTADGEADRPTPCDPVLHTNLIVGRDALLGNDSAFIKLIRLVKHLNEQWTRRFERVTLTSFELEALALTACAQPLAMADGTVAFLRQAAELVTTPISHPLLPDCLLPPRAPVEKAALLEDAADRCEEALLARDTDTVERLLGGVFS